MANTDIFEPFVFESAGALLAESKASDRTSKKQDRTAALTGSLSPSSTKLVNPLALLDVPLADTSGMHSIYCAPCKKKFSSEATFEAHLQSDKHKRAARQATAGSALKPKSAHHPVVQGALKSMAKAQALADKDPAVAATVLWNIAKDIAQFNDDRVTRTSLDGALSCMQVMDADASLRGEKGSPGAWTARSLFKTMLECQLAQARLESRTSRQWAASLYSDALCCYLGIASNLLDIGERDRTPSMAWTHADKLVKAIPRKFTRAEDVDQAIGAMEEVAAALLAFSKTVPADATLLWRSVAVYSTTHAFSLQKDRGSAAYTAVRRLAALFDGIGLAHFGCECASLVIDHHMQQPGSRAVIAAAIVASLQSLDLVRASCLLKKYNYRFEEPWSHYLAELVCKTADADTIWLSTDAWNLWCQVSSTCDRHIYELVDNAVRTELRPLMWYSPIETSRTNHNDL
ncbi:hypothetical protein GGI20_003242 [Coemansia sp. BCRC 34301]|nr:hypothetical protein GGI20_003242 [Coemansia sp. BCRC 34301]